MTSNWWIGILAGWAVIGCCPSLFIGGIMGGLATAIMFGETGGPVVQGTGAFFAVCLYIAVLIGLAIRSYGQRQNEKSQNPKGPHVF